MRLAQESFPGWRALEAECGRPLLELHGTLDLGNWEPNRDALAACGEPFEVLGGAEIERRFGIRAGERRALPGGRRDRLRGPRPRVAARLGGGGRSRRAGAGPRRRRRGGRETQFPSAASARAPPSSPPARGHRGSSASTPRRHARRCRTSSSTSPCPPCSTPAGERRRPTRCSRPGSGSRPGFTRPGRRPTRTSPAQPDEAIAERTAAWVAHRFPHAGTRARSETCLYTIRANDEFLLERRGRVVVGSPCSGHGFKFAPAIGERLAGLVDEVL